MRTILDIGEGVDRHVILETEPQPRTVKIAHCEVGCNERTVRYLSMPYAQYYLRSEGSRALGQLFVTFSTDPFKIGRKTYATFLPNSASSSGQICMNKRLKVSPEDYVTDYWDSIFCVFEHHVEGRSDEYWLEDVQEIKSLDSWEENTRKNPYYIMEIDWSQQLKEVDVVKTFAEHHHFVRQWLRKQK